MLNDIFDSLEDLG